MGLSLARLLGVLARLPLWARMEAFISRLPPYGALVVFCVPALLLLPVRLLALYWIGRATPCSAWPWYWVPSSWEPPPSPGCLH